MEENLEQLLEKVMERQLANHMAPMVQRVSGIEKRLDEQAGQIAALQAVASADGASSEYTRATVLPRPPAAPTNSYPDQDDGWVPTAVEARICIRDRREQEKLKDSEGEHLFGLLLRELTGNLLMFVRELRSCH